ncbi:hypothetical protein [Actinophytocola gossypii]|uniref:Uncharacterized protein n=1 Tax=Actinophytocola gossypii TaxID=2812003 RepID=A0ABT2JJN4_9PSEU|nr:hypothetical protein [Actinophytocola gossypii]MCT2587605.1 hypothetical protein [Actinophytocola gossypii]
MRLKRIVSASLLALAAVVTAGPVAQADPGSAPTASCAPAERQSWLGDFRGTWTMDEDGQTGTMSISLFVEGGEMRAVINSSNIAYDAYVDDGYARTYPNNYSNFTATAATCDSGGAVTSFSGTWEYHYNPGICWSCWIFGTFEVSRI